MPLRRSSCILKRIWAADESDTPHLSFADKPFYPSIFGYLHRRRRTLPASKIGDRSRMGQLKDHINSGAVLPADPKDRSHLRGERGYNRGCGDCDRSHQRRRKALDSRLVAAAALNRHLRETIHIDGRDLPIPSSIRVLEEPPGLGWRGSSKVRGSDIPSGR